MAAVYQQQTTPIYPTLTQSDIDIRDPNDINKHLRLDFFNVIAEPDHSAYSWEFLHTASNYVYQYSKLFIYRLLTILVGLPLMLFWGLTFGAYTFMMIWIAVPSRRLAQSLIAESGVYIQSFCDAVIGPVHRSMGLLFSNIRITYNPVANPPKTIEV